MSSVNKEQIQYQNKLVQEAQKLCTSEQYAAAVHLLYQAIELGHLEARALLAWMLLQGRKNVDINVQKAFKLVDEGTCLGCNHCQGVVAYCYFWGFGCEQDKIKALKMALESSKNGSRYGQLVLGLLQFRGQGGLDVNMNKAFTFYQLAAEQGLDRAQYQLADIISLGIGVTQDHSEALRLYKLAAAQGFQVAFYMIAQYYQFGKGVPIDYIEALRWYQLAVDQGDIAVFYNIGFLHEKGLGVPIDKNKAIEWYRRGAAMYDSFAEYALIRLGCK